MVMDNQQSASLHGKKGIVPICRNGPEGASHKWGLSPFSLSGQTLFLFAAIVVSVGGLIGLWMLSNPPPGPGPAAAEHPPATPPASEAAGESTVSKFRREEIPFDGARAYEYLKQLCAIGPRRSGSAGMAAQQKLLVDHFQKLGGKVEWQRFQARHPLDGSLVPMANLIIHWNPESKERVLLCGHYDTLPFPLMDPDNARGVFVGANDNGSGVALLMELGRHVAKRTSSYGVDFVMLDGEEFIFRRDGDYFLGSEHFARTYAKAARSFTYRWGVLLDMVGSTTLQLYQEGYSTSWRDTRPLVESIWATAARLGVREFVAQRKYDIRDDHLPIHQIARIPICDIIDAGYMSEGVSPPWHTQGDTPDKCSALSLAKVGWVLDEWLKTAGEGNEAVRGAPSPRPSPGGRGG
jgi:glutaminyl-peptide cyclotransferase